MYEIFDTAIGFVLDYYSKGEKSKSCLCTYRKYLMKLRAYLVSGGIEYSHMEALKWLSREFAFLRYGQYKVCRRMVFRVNDFILNGTITQREYIYSDFLDNMRNWTNHRKTLSMNSLRASQETTTPKIILSISYHLYCLACRKLDSA